MSARWHAMTLLLNDYAQHRHYTLAAIFLEPPRERLANIYYVQADIPEAAEIIGRVRGLSYGNPRREMVIDLPASLRSLR